MIGTDRLAHASLWRRHALAEKALLSLGLLALALVLPPWPGGALVLLVAVKAAIRAGTPPAALLRLALAPLGFVVTGAATLLVGWQDGPVLLPPGPALDLALRALAAIFCLLLLTVTTPAAALVQGLRRLGLPAELAELALVIYRFVFILGDTAAAMHASQQARLGHEGWRRRIRSAGLLAAALLPRALDRARRMEIGLAARGFDGSLRTLAPTYPISGRRLAAIALVLIAVGGAGAWM